MGYLKIENVSKNFGKQQVLANISLDVKRGEFIVLLGP
jgi:ABC-type sugar transport system ATPase subunit